MNRLFRKVILDNISKHEATRPQRRPRSFDAAEAIDCLFTLVRTGMQWREVRAKTGSYTTVFKHVHRWIEAGVIQDAYSSVLKRHVHSSPPQHYIVDSRMLTGVKVSVETQSTEVVKD